MPLSLQTRSFFCTFAARNDKMEPLLTIYKASAGSGKTFALAVEYIAGLLQPYAENEFVHTLAVTFTNKATAEMKGRILETLYALKMGLEEADDYMDAIMRRGKEQGTRSSGQDKPLTETQIRQQAGKALTAILHDYSHFRVETIDSFFQSVLRGMARELGLAANLQVELSHEEVIDSAVDSLISAMDTKPEVKRWVMDYVREQLDSGDKWDIVGPLKSFAGNIFGEEYQQRSDEELARISDAEVVGDFKRKMQTIRRRAKQEVEAAASDVIGRIEDINRISYGKNLLSFLLRAREMESDGPSKTIQEQADGSKPLYKKEQGARGEGQADSDLQQALADFIALYAGCRREYLSATLALRHLAPLRLLEYIDERAREIEGEAGRFTLSSTPALLSKMVEGSDAPFIFEKMGTFIDNVMIDEFQDTSRMQWENFKKLLFEKLASGGKVLLVGDIKQSIYRWRGGDWKVLYGIEHEPELKRFNLHPLPLDTNYRSHQVIVDFNNAFFPAAAQRLDALMPDARINLSNIYADVRQKKKKEDGEGHVRIQLYKEEDATLSDMADRIRSLQAAGLELGEIAILVRTNAMAQQLIEGFSEQAPDIRFVSDEAFLLEASVCVQMIIAAMRMLVDKEHTDGISEKYLMLHYLRDVLGKPNTTVLSVAQQKAEEVLPEAFTAHQGELLQLPLYLLAERLWHIFSLSSIRGEDVYVLTFFDELQNYLRGTNAPDIQTFLNAWDEQLRSRSVPGSSAAGVRILTIHKSKGLAFHTVMLPFSHWQIEADRQGDVLWCETDIAPYNELGALPISTYSKDVRTSVFAPDYQEEHLERRVDALNTLYVAFTRAKCNLYVWGQVKPAEKIKAVSTAAELIYLSLRNDENDLDEGTFLYEAGKPLITVHASSSQERTNRLSVRHRAEDAIDVKVITRTPTLDFLQSNQTKDYLQQQVNAESEERPMTSLSQREIGKRMHEVLSRIDDVSQLKDVLAETRQEGILGEDEEWEAIVSRIREGFRDPLVASWFKTGNAVYNECGIAGTNAETGQPEVLRPDRVVIREGCITVIDYKFGHPSRLYSEQVRTYMNLMKQMYPRHEVKGYLWYIMAGKTIRVYNS